MGFGLVFAANLLVLGYSVIVFINVESKALAIEKKWVPATRLVRDATFDLYDIRSNNLGHVIFNQPVALDAFEAGRSLAIQRAAADLTALKMHLAGTGHFQLAEIFESQLREFTRVTDRTIELSREGNKDAARAWVQTQGTLVYDVAAASGRRLLSLVDSEAQRAIVAAQASSGRARTNLVWAAGLTLVWTLVVGTLLSAGLSRPLVQLTEAARKVARGRLTEVAPVEIKDSDEIGVLAEAFNLMIGEIRSTQEGLEELVRKRTAELEKANEDLVRADKHKGQFLAMTTHELRTPLTLILGYGEDLLDGSAGPLNDRQRRFLEKMQISAKTLLDLVNELLDFSRVEAGKMRLAYSAFPVGRLFDDLKDKGSALASMAGAGFRAELNGDSSGMVWADRNRISQVVLNLLANAAKFTPAGGGIDLIFSVEPDRLEVEVGDTGVGIERSAWERIFEAFEQGPAPANPQGTRAGGFGLGLPLARRLAELHAGTLEVTSRPGQGSRFTLRIPRWPANRQDHDLDEGGKAGANANTSHDRRR